MGVKLLVSWLTLTAEPAGVSFTQAELDQIFELLEDLEEMSILFSDETLAPTYHA